MVNEREDEVFVDMPDYPGYQISNYGTVISYRQGTTKILKSSPDKDGYLRVGLMVNGKIKMRKIHRLVALHFIRNDISSDNVLFLTNDKSNLYYKNLTWDKNPKPCNELNDNQINELQEQILMRQKTYNQLAKEYNVYESTIYRIANEINYSNINENSIYNVNAQDLSISTPMLKYSEEDIQSMYAHYLWGASIEDLSYAFNMSPKYVRDIVNRKRRTVNTDIFYNTCGNLKPPILISPIRFKK